MIWFRWPCDRCGKDFRAQVIARDCPPCASFGAVVTGLPFPVGEMGGE